MAKGRNYGTRVSARRPVVVRNLLLEHKESTFDHGRHCSCGYLVAEDETIQDHWGRMICNELFHTQFEDKIDHTADHLLHRGSAYNIAMHRALHEPICTACLDYMDNLP